MNAFFSQLLFGIPGLIVGIVGLVLALARWSRHPRVSLLVTLGISVLLLATLGAAVFYGLIAPKMMAMANHPAPAAMFGIASLCFSLLHQAGIVLLLLAAFAGRQPQTPPPLR